ncbi:MAG TPA: YlxR family protein [Bacilli bacterium]|nr:YlxR family protein [Bacilli bacterium]
MKKIPERMCVITKEKMPKKELLRIVRTPEGEVVVDQTGKQNGKGAYLKKDAEVIVRAQKSKVLEKVLEVTISEEVYAAMLETIK